MFLDIACFFKGKHRDYVTSIMDACYDSAHSGIENLIDKSLISVSQNQIAMHDLLQQMGWNIVRDESPLKLEKRSRLWIPEDSYSVLSENNGLGLTGIVLDMSKLPNLELEPTALMKMRKLRILKFYHSCGRILHFKGLLSFPNELRYLYWDGYPLRSLPAKFDLRYLVELDMRWSHLEQLWEGKQDLVNLKIIRLDGSQNLVRIPDPSSATNLEKIDLWGCSRLETFPEIMDTMERLRRLDLDQTALKELPSSIDNLIGLEELVLNNCENLVCLPDNFYKLKSLKRLTLQDCSRLEIFPEIFCKLKFLEKLDLKGCSRLEIFPEILETMERLGELDLKGMALKELPPLIGNLIGLVKLILDNCENLVCLPNSFCKLKFLRLTLQGCSRLETFPEIMDTMERLRRLDLDQTALKELPSSIDNLIGLEELVLNNCENLVCLPDNFYKLKSLKRLTLQDCSRLEIFPEILETMERLRDLDLSGTALKELPSSVENLIGLEYLILENCENLVCLPDNFYKLKSLNIFDLEGCSRLEIFPKDIVGLSSLYRLDLSESNLENLPTTIKKFPCLEKLILRKCKRLKSLPELPPSLVYLDADDCTSLEDVSSIKKHFEQIIIRSASSSIYIFNLANG
ncbi:hypothetical protein V6Z11_D11G328800 [Gossypium hirsutum]